MNYDRIKSNRLEIYTHLLKVLKDEHLTNGEFTSGKAIRIIEGELRKEQSP